MMTPANAAMPKMLMTRFSPPIDSTVVAAAAAAAESALLSIAGTEEFRDNLSAANARGRKP